MKNIIGVELKLTDKETGETTITRTALSTVTKEATLGAIAKMKEIAKVSNSILECRIRSMRENLVGVQYTL